MVQVQGQDDAGTDDSAAELQVDAAIVIDFGSQTAQLIVRRVREANVYCELIAHDADASVLERLQSEGDHPLRRADQRLR